MTLDVPSGLVAAATAGDRAALSTLLARSQPDIRRFAQRSCRTASDVEDAVQETLWLMTRRIAALRRPESFSAWAFTIVRRECLRLARTLRLLPPEQADALLDDLISTRTDDDLRLDLASAIQSLPDHYRLVLLLRDVEERTIGEIADALGLTRETVKARLHRARALVREYLTR